MREGHDEACAIVTRPARVVPLVAGYGLPTEPWPWPTRCGGEPALRPSRRVQASDAAHKDADGTPTAALVEGRGEFDPARARISDEFGSEQYQCRTQSLASGIEDVIPELANHLSARVDSVL